MNRLLGYTHVGSSEDPTDRPPVSDRTVGLNTFGSHFIWSHHNSLDNAFVWSSPFSLPSNHQSYYSPVSRGGRVRVLGDKEPMHRRGSVRTQTYWRSAYSFPTYESKGKCD
ncbi:hypothetical protein TrRE_jg5065 [Triparma retinervis]|uniref:Uncharacterized protein n=1 Tax=Triparma retinervis TaxID=2557542 RepID=A0A9W7A6F7_9STRA|nr:hypothetical protein TrRE_jg5065 [Triparma retinervis]